MDENKAREILRRIGEGGKLEVKLYARVCSSVDDDGFDCTDGSTSGRSGDSLIGRLTEIGQKDENELSFIIDDGTGNNGTRIYYAHVHSIYQLIRKPSSPLATADQRFRLIRQEAH